MDHTQEPTQFRMSLHGLPYDRTVPDQPPIPVLTSSSQPTADQLKAYSFPRSVRGSTKANLQPERDPRRDSGMAGSSLRYSGHSATTDDQPQSQSQSSLTSKPSLPQIRLETPASLSPPTPNTHRPWRSTKPNKPTIHLPPSQPSFQGISLDIPTGGLELAHDLQPENMEFSNRGSVLLRPRKVTDTSAGPPSHQSSTLPARRAKSSPSLRKARHNPRILSTDEELLSQKVRSCYDAGMDSFNGHNADARFSEPQAGCLSAGSALTPKSALDVPIDAAAASRQVSGQHSPKAFRREERELAGGLEDWRDLDGGDVDRYGFIMPRSAAMRSSNKKKNGAATGAAADVKRSTSAKEPPSLQRVSTSLQLAAEAPRRKHTLRGAPSNTPPHVNESASHTPTRSTRPASSQSAYRDGLTGQRSRFRQATNRLPHNRDRRFMDQAGDMLTLPTDSAGTTDKGEPRPKENYRRRKEIAREDKWQKMAKVVSKREDGGGTLFTFDTNSPKVIERTWKGIPDRWRATVWHSFMSTSAQKKKDSVSDERLIAMFNEYQELASPDDVQIDIDVPRTISSHIMFRRRYRGGQRLLFRVLHAMSLHFPSTAYVQGMAALAATLLAYYDEEHAFVMLARMWELRGLEKLYQAGFDGLMEALDDFEKRWLQGGEISVRLTELGIPPTSYGTRWYLTLFNYSIPFPAQLRVWDVFILLGDDSTTTPSSSAPTPTPASAPEPSSPPSSSPSTSLPPSPSPQSPSPPSASPPSPPRPANFGTTLDVLHATSAALIDGVRAILLDSDFENAMKVLTSWVPIQDEDLFMRVAKAEWRLQRKRR